METFCSRDANKYRDDELAKWVDVWNYSGTFVEGRGWNLQAETEVFEVGKLGGGHASEKSKVIMSENGHKMELKELETPPILSIAAG